MSIEKRTERNTKQRERYNITKSADEKDEVSCESIKKERDRKRYAEMPPLLRHEKIVKTNEGRRQKNNYLTGEQINTPVTGNLQSVLTQQQSPPLNKFDSGLWEPDDPMHGVEENDFDQLNPEDYGPADIEDDETRVFHHQDFQYQYAVDDDIGYRGSDPYDAVYKDLPKKHHVLKKSKNCQFCHAKRFLVKGLPSTTGKGRLIYIFQRYRLSSAACLPVRLTTMQNILGSTFVILTVTSHSQALEFPLIIISHLQEVLVSIVLKHTVRFIIDWISLFLVGEGHGICSYIFMTLIRPLRIGSRGLLSLILQ